MQLLKHPAAPPWECGDGLALQAVTVRDWLVTHGARILTVLLAIVVAQLLIRRLVPPAIRRGIVVRSGTSDTVELEKRAHTLSSVIVRVAVFAMLVTGVFVVLAELGYSLTPVLTGIGISGIAIGLGAQGLVKDTINGLLILGENQFRHGDYVTVAGVSGTVEDLNLRRVILRDIDGTVHFVPNSIIQIASNHTRDYSGLNVLILVSHNADLDEAIAVATRTGAELASDPQFAPDIVEAPQPVRIDAIDEKGVALRILGRVRPGKQGAVAFAYRRQLKEAFDAAGLRYSTARPAPVQATGDGPQRTGDGPEATRDRND